MKINLIYYLYEVNGAFTSFEDTFYNLSKFTNHNVNFFILYEDKYMLAQFKKYLPKGSGICLLELPKTPDKGTNLYKRVAVREVYHTMVYNIKGDINIISSEVIRLQKANRIKQSASQEMLLYPAFIYKEQGLDKTFYNDEQEYIKNNDVLVICNKFNTKYVNNSFVWYMQFSKERIEQLKKLVSNENDVLCAEEYYKNKMNCKNIEPFSYKKYEYYRYDKKNETNCYTDDGARYYENIGKLMFEFVLLGKESSYSPRNKQFDDGLTEFMNYLGYDDNQLYWWNYKDISYLEKRLFMNKENKLLSLFK